jgi:deoxyribodipyrimidine photolyase
MHVVWFKRDLRIHDHAGLREAGRAGSVLAL